MEPVINILIRTGNRPDSFRKMWASIQEQTYKNIRPIICFDNYLALDYLPHHTTLFKPKTKANPGRFYWNLYCNELKSTVEEGWFFYLDDDDYLHDYNAVARMVAHLPAPGEALICQFKRGETKKPVRWTGRPVRGKIGGSCIVLHHSQKDVGQWDDMQASDYRFIKQVLDKIPHRFAPTVLVQAGNNGLHGWMQSTS